MSSVTRDGYTFTRTGSGRVIVSGPGILISGIDLGYASDLSPAAILQAVSSPNLTDAARSSLQSLAGDASSIQSGLTPNNNPTQAAADAASGGTQGGQPPPAVPADSAGALAQNDSQARQGGNTQNPPTGAGPAPDAPATTTGSGVDTRSERTTDPSGNVVTGYETTSSGGVVQAQNRSGTVNDDTRDVLPITGATTYNDGRVTIPNAFIEDIATRENPLNQFVSSSYTISIYLQTPESYRQMVKNGRRSLLGAQLLMQSGGAAANSQEAQNQYFDATSTPATVTNTSDTTTVTATTIPNLNRSPFFDVDFYIDDLSIKSYVTGTATGSAHNVGEITFRITEPNGITLLDRLKAAVVDFLGNEAGRDLNYAAQQYLMVIRFYGYDQNGNLVKRVSDNPADVNSDPRAYMEKYIPFVWTECKFRVASKVVEYECKGVSPNYSVGFSAAHASIPFNIELSGGTLQDILLGPTEVRRQSQDPQELQQSLDGNGPPPPTANSAPGPADTVKRGLVEALNEAERRRARQTGVEPNFYSIKFVPGFRLETATLIGEGAKNKRQSPLNDPTKGTSKNPDRGAVNNSSRNYTITAGTQIVQVLSMLIQRSSYIRDQQLVVYDKDGKPIERPTGGNAPVTQWFKIRCFVEPIKYDAKKNDYAYNVTYVIGPYQINDPKSEYFPRSRTRSPHKRYRYWFTGQNDQVLSFEQDFNYLYYIAMSAQNPLQAVTSSGREKEKRYPQTRSDQPTQGDPATVNEPASNLASILYSPGDQARIKLKIVGDPDWLQQNEIFYNRNGDVSGELAVQAFMPDGSINYDAQEPILEVSFNTPTDYDFTTGVLAKASLGTAGQSDTFIGSRIADFRYRANIITSNFSRGSFTQEIEGSLMIYQIPDRSAQSPETAETTGPEPAPTGGQPPDTLDIRPGQIGDVANRPLVSTPRVPNITNYLNQPKTATSLNSFGDAVNQALAKPALPIPPPTPPTSNGQVVEPAQQAEVRRIDNAIGPITPTFAQRQAAAAASIQAARREQLGLAPRPKTVKDDTSP